MFRHFMVLALASCLACPPARAADAADAADAAEDLNTRVFVFDAFGTFGLVHSSEDKADFPHNGLATKGAGFTDRWSSNVDSLAGAQVTATVSSRLSAVVQVVAEYNYDNTFRPHVEWANLKVQLTPGLSMRVGRTSLPVFMLTDTRKIGYAMTGVRPPVELYNLLPLAGNDGVDALWQRSLGAATNTVQVTFGQTDTKFATVVGGSGVAQSRNQVTLAETYERGFLTLRGNIGRTHVTVSAFDPLFDAFRQFGPAGAAIADQYEVKHSPVNFMGLGASYDPGKWFATAEWGKLQQPNVFRDRSGWYVSGGARFARLWPFGTLTPYITYGQIAPKDSTVGVGLDLSSLPPFLAVPAATLNGALDQVLASAPAQATQTLGVRWDVLPKVALTVQFDHIDMEKNSAGVFVNIQPGFQRGGSANLLSVSVDFVL